MPTKVPVVKSIVFPVVMYGSRAKERFFSHRDEFGQWDPKNQRPELWNIFNGKKNLGEHFRVFPISNWTEMDVWQYILQENIPLPSLYYTHERDVFERDGVWLAHYPFMQLKPNEKVVRKQVRCRTIGDITCTGLTLSSANSDVCCLGTCLRLGATTRC